MALLNEIEERYPNNLVLGIDEAGRGPLCGPVVVAGCILDKDYTNELIDDSKKLSEKKRKKAFLEIIEAAIYFKIVIVEPKIIDQKNIYQATKDAMKEIALDAPTDIICTDAMPLEIDKEVFPIIKGDQKSINIAAASILAKVVRDHIMMGYHHLYPQYEFNKHKGYPTKRHIELLNTYGLLPIYRMSYKPCQEVNELKLF